MAKIRKIEIKNFRSIKSLTWLPLPGVNCLIGPGDIGKSTILDAIDLCLGARRSISISDADFHSLDIGCAISITLTLGDLEDSLKSIEAYGIYFQAFNSETGEVLEEPKRGLETVLNLNLTINDDLEPEWSLVSGRATSQRALRSSNFSGVIHLKIPSNFINLGVSQLSGFIPLNL